MFKNKLIAFLCLAVIILLALCSCGGLDEPDKSESPFKDVLEGHAEAYAELPSWAPDTVMNMFRITEKNANGRFLGTIVTVKVGGYADFIFMTVGIDSDGNITKVVINRENETHGSAGMKNYPDVFAGVSSDELSEVDTYSGATVSSTAIKNGVIDAMKAVMGNESVTEPEPEEVLPKTDAEIKAIAAALMGVNSSDLEDVTPANTTLVKRVYKCARGYAVYAITAGGWGGSMDTESVIWIGADGKIKGIEKLTFTTSPASNVFTPPTQAEIDAFYNRLVGASSSTVSNVDIITGATHTSSMLKNAISEALLVVENLKRN